MGWRPSKLVVLLNLIILLGYCLIDAVIAGQILSAVSVHGNMSIAVGKFRFRSIQASKLMFCRNCDCRTRDAYRHHIWSSTLSYLRKVIHLTC
jgi:hypothetical protein